MRVTYSIRNFSLAARCFHPPTIPSSILHSHTVYHVPCTQHPAYMYEEYSLIFIPFVVVALFSAVGRRYKKKFRYCLCFMVCSVPSGLNGCSTHCPCNSCKPTSKSEWKKNTSNYGRIQKKNYNNKNMKHRILTAIWMCILWLYRYTYYILIVWTKTGEKSPCFRVKKLCVVVYNK